MKTYELLVLAHLKAITYPLLDPLQFAYRPNRTPSVELLKFADDTTLIGLISEGDESAYRQVVEQLVAWRSNNNLELKALEMIVDFRRNPPPPPPLVITGSAVTTVESFKFLGSTISRELEWKANINTIVKKAQQRMYFLRQLKKFNPPQATMVQFYITIIESILTSAFTVWLGSSTARDRTGLQRITRMAERIIGLQPAHHPGPLQYKVQETRSQNHS
ncbi:hypothetical protein SKAU_G00241420 [Synaphobranchus kaupii]|uniref:Alkylated DNA repair protein AlkB homologue 8 N-terminal domain-containing protein n=1 Tax=Synaphobranchus kaupii TaxID=118154 RepID=A0A9Q1F7M0_SYNKA|nr:hypothetical protein SKAU_G00241420 [Synaphobranchus kaupii]